MPLMRLPEKFLENMKGLLGEEEYAAWLAGCGEPSWSGLRINTAKIRPEEWERISPYGRRRVSWTPNGYYYDADRRPARDPYYYAGLYYLQEPSAMAPAAVLPVEPGDRVLDLCAAPGGKSTELGARLFGKGLLVSNDISSSRARALLKNLELAGIGNVCVTSESPEKLAGVFGSFFHKILVDAPCSGEGMFRRDPDLVKNWEVHGPEDYVPLQREILSQAVRMLLPGGYLLYSTCTFSVREDEENVQWLLGEYPAMELVPVSLWEGAREGMDGSPVVRLFPHRVQGEGHFLALFRKRETESGENAGSEGIDPGGMSRTAGTREETAPKHVGSQKRARGPEPVRPGIVPGAEKGRLIQKESGGKMESVQRNQEQKLLDDSDFASWERQVGTPYDRDRMMVRNGQVYLLPEDFQREWNLRYLRTGLLLGELKKGRFEPSQAVAMTLEPALAREWEYGHDGAAATDGLDAGLPDVSAGSSSAEGRREYRQVYKQVFSMDHGDERVVRYLKGETISLLPEEAAGLASGKKQPAGWILVCVDRYPLGWARLAGSNLKNKYHPGWRWQ